MTIEHEPVKVCAQIGHEWLNVHVHRCMHLEAVWGHVQRSRNVSDDENFTISSADFERGPFDDHEPIILEIVARVEYELRRLLSS
jgi:hypothetical protein